MIKKVSMIRLLNNPEFITFIYNRFVPINVAKYDPCIVNFFRCEWVPELRRCQLL